MAVAVGPAETVGHPFRVATEVPVERDIGGHRTFAFGTKWLYSDLDVTFDEKIDAVIVWDPGWLRTGTGEGAKHELQILWDRAQEWDAPIVGLYSDWFAAWKVDSGISGTIGSVMFCDAIIVDGPGKAAMTHSIAPLRVHEPTDRRFRPIAMMERFLTYGRLPRVGGHLDVEMKKIHERDIDVCMVSTLHPQHVVLRPYYVDKMESICRLNGWAFEWTDKASAAEMEELYLNSKVVFNCSLGSQPNCRVYEGLACGALLLTDGWNVGMDGVPGTRYINPFALEYQLKELLDMDARRQDGMQEAGLEWAQRHSPEKTWANVIDAALHLAEHTGPAREARAKFAREYANAN